MLPALSGAAKTSRRAEKRANRRERNRVAMELEALLGTQHEQARDDGEARREENVIPMQEKAWQVEKQPYYDPGVRSTYFTDRPGGRCLVFTVLAGVSACWLGAFATQLMHAGFAARAWFALAIISTICFGPFMLVLICVPVNRIVIEDMIWPFYHLYNHWRRYRAWRIRRRSAKSVLEKLEREISEFARDIKGQTPDVERASLEAKQNCVNLLRACLKLDSKGIADIIDANLQAGADRASNLIRLSKTFQETTALEVAFTVAFMRECDGHTEDGLYDVAAMICEEGKVGINDRRFLRYGTENTTVLMLACKMRAINALKFLLCPCRSGEHDEYLEWIDETDEDGMNALMFAAEAEFVEGVKELVAHGACITLSSLEKWQAVADKIRSRHKGEILETISKHSLVGRAQPAHISLPNSMNVVVEYSNVLGASLGAKVYGGVLTRPGGDREIVAVKVCELVRQERSFYGEAQMLAKLHHSNIVKFHGFATMRKQVIEGNELYIVMERCNRSLHDHLHVQKDPLCPRSIVKWMCQCAEVLVYLRKEKVVHRDIKPQNILICKSDSEDAEETIRVADFGIARRVGHATQQAGTIAYMAPELRSSNPTYKSDLYSFGVVLWDCVERSEPSEAREKEGPRSDAIDRAFRRNNVGVRLQKLVAKCTCTFPESRPDVNEILGELQSILINL